MSLFYFSKALVFICILLFVSYTDVKKRVIPNWAVAAGIIYCMICESAVSLIVGKGEILYTVKNLAAGLAAGFLPIFLIASAAMAVSKKECIGGGDIKLYAMCGMFLGLKAALQSYVILSVISILLVTILLLFKKVKRTDTIPFGPVIAAASAITFFISVR